MVLKDDRGSMPPRSCSKQTAAYYHRCMAAPGNDVEKLKRKYWSLYIPE